MYMVSLIVKKQDEKKAYYLHHTVRTKTGFKNYDKYLGNNIPKDIVEQKLEFFLDVYKDTFNEIEKIKDKYQKNEKSLPKSIKEKILEQFGIKFTYNTNRIEGSTLSLKNTLDVIKEGIIPKMKPIRDIKETEAHYKLFLKIITEKQKINYNVVLDWHHYLFKETKPDIAGQIRSYAVYITGSKFVPPSPAEVYPEFKDFFKWYEKSKDRLDPVVLAALVHLKFVTVHPFGDGNGRISRLLMNCVLNNKKYPLYNIDYIDRRSYYDALEKTQMKKDDIYFIKWFVKNYLKYIKSNKY